MKPLLVTSALPYANGHIHLGHLVEYTQTDIWVRAQRMSGRKAVYICADDTHGTAITMRARGEGRSELEVIEEMNAAHQADFADFQIVFDHYGSTHSEENRQFAGEIWRAFEERGMVRKADVTQLFDPEAGVFLADRFVKGNCPRCDSPDQYGDSCDKCMATYSAIELKNPRSTLLRGAVPEIRSAPHLFVQIEPEHAWLTEFTQSEGRMPREIANYLQGHFLGDALRDWDVSRPAPYFGFEIPGHEGHYFYVWFDAPIGYLAATKQYCDKSGESFDAYWRGTDAEIVHVIGKDIVYFHTLFWPVMLKTAGFNLPSRVQVHGFLTVNGEKMSKSKGTFINGRTFLDHLDPAYLRYYYASKLSPKVDDIDLNLEEFEKRVNGELVNKVVNLASRSARFLQKDGFAAVYPEDGGLFEAGAAACEEIEKAYKNWDFARVTRLAMGLADRANEYVDRMQPWALAKQPGKEQEVIDVCTVALNAFRQIVIYLAPVLPKLATETQALLGASFSTFAAAKTPLLGSPIGTYQHLMKRVEPEKIAKMIEDSKTQQPEASAVEAHAPAAPAAVDDGSALEKEPLAATCSIDDFAKVDMRVARIVLAEAVPEAKKLLKLTVSLGGDNTRTVFAGIKAYYKPEDLVGRLVIVCANLAPRQMKFGLSEGMVLAAGADGEAFVLSPDSGAKAGQRVH